ncbi:MAG: hypothetical protein WCK05_13035 [Planctomycetota bacterium]
MPDRKIELARLEITNPEDPNRPGKTTLDVELRYDLGGSNMFSGRSEPRGYYLSVSPITRSHDGNWKSYSGFSGVKQCVQPATRFSKRELALLAQFVLAGEVYPPTRRPRLRQGDLHPRRRANPSHRLIRAVTDGRG